MTRALFLAAAAVAIFPASALAQAADGRFGACVARLGKAGDGGTGSGKWFLLEQADEAVTAGRKADASVLFAAYRATVEGAADSPFRVGYANCELAREMVRRRRMSEFADSLTRAPADCVAEHWASILQHAVPEDAAFVRPVAEQAVVTVNKGPFMDTLFSRHARLGVQCLRLGFTDLALKLLENLIAREDGVARSHDLALLARAFVSSGHVDHATRAVAAAGCKPASVEGYVALADAHLSTAPERARQYLADTERCTREKLESYSEVRIALFVALAYARAGDLTAATRMQRSAETAARRLKANRMNTLAYIAIGWARLGNPKELARSIAETVKHEPRDRDDDIGDLPRELAAAGHLDEAEQALTAIEKVKSVPEARRRVLWAAQKQKDYARALRLARGFAGCDDRVSALVSTSSHLLDDDRRDEALEVAKEAARGAASCSSGESRVPYVANHVAEAGGTMAALELIRTGKSRGTRAALLGRTFSYPYVALPEADRALVTGAIREAARHVDSIAGAEKRDLALKDLAISALNVGARELALSLAAKMKTAQWVTIFNQHLLMRARTAAEVESALAKNKGLQLAEGIAAAAWVDERASEVYAALDAACATDALR